MSEATRYLSIVFEIPRRFAHNDRFIKKNSSTSILLPKRVAFLAHPVILSETKNLCSCFLIFFLLAVVEMTGPDILDASLTNKAHLLFYVVTNNSPLML